MSAQPFPPDFRFDGFTEPRYTQIPNEFFDVLLPHLGEAELRVLLYLFRRTFGWHKQTDGVSLTQFTKGIPKHDGAQVDFGCGVRSRSHTSAALRNLEERGIIQAFRRRGDDGVHLTTYYTVRWINAPVVPVRDQAYDPESDYPNARTALPPSAPKAPTVVPESDPQNTRQKTDQKTPGQNARRAQSATGGWGKKGKRDLEGKYSHLVQR